MEFDRENFRFSLRRMTFLTRIDHAKKMSRFYVVRVAPTLFGEWSVLREWGRMGSPGTVRSRSFEREQEAQKAGQCSIRRRLRNGYRATDAAHDPWL